MSIDPGLTGDTLVRLIFPMEDPDDPGKSERESYDYQAGAAGDAWRQWAEGLVLLRDSLGTLRGKSGRINVSVRLAFLIRGWNSLHCAFDLGAKGWHQQAMNLLRLTVEDFIAYRYLERFLDEWTKFVDPEVDTPRFNQMKQRLEEALRSETGAPEALTQVQQLLTGLHQYSHPDTPSLFITAELQPSMDTVDYWFGPRGMPVVFRNETRAAINSLNWHLQAVEDLRAELGLERQPAVDDYRERLKAWVAEGPPPVTMDAP